VTTDLDDDDAAVVLAEVDERFHVRDEASATWVVRKINEERAHRRRVMQWHEAELRRSERREAFLLHRFGAELTDWTRQQLAKQFGKLRSIHLPSGIVGFRVEPTRIVIADQPTLIAWCRAELPSAIKTVEHLLKSEINALVKASGEIPPGAELAGGGERFYIK
jgi:hypothetical protein